MINAWSKDFKLLVQDSWVLVEASKSGNLELVKYLIDKGANLNTRIKSAMQAAITYRHYNIFKYLVELSGYLDVVKYLMNHIPPDSVRTAINDIYNNNGNNGGPDEYDEDIVEYFQTLQDQL